MSKKITVLALALVFMAMPAFAAVQNVKVGGDIDAKAIYQEDFDLKSETLGTNADDDGFFLSTARVRIDADLTDNVSTTVRFLNQRKWDTDGAATGDIELNLGYVTLKELLYSPLTVTIGRQDITFGRGFIIGAGLLQDPNSVFTGANAAGRQFSAYNSYDAIKAVLDYDPLTLTAVIIKLDESGTAQNDSDIYGINLGYKPGQLNSEVEAYWFFKRDEAFGSTLGLPARGVGTRTYEQNSVHTLGVKGSVAPAENLSLFGEVAFQSGELRDQTGPFDGSTNGVPIERDRSAWAANLEGSYAFSNVAYSPGLTLGWTFYSGEEAGNAGDFDAWDSMTRGEFFTGIHDFLAGSQGGGLYGTVDPDDTSAATNSHLFYVDGGIKPLEDLNLSLRYTHIRFDEAPVAGRSKKAGDEVDLQLSYNYTEDVRLWLLAGWFVPGKYYDGQTTAASRSDDTAAIVAGSVSVAF